MNTRSTTRTDARNAKVTRPDYYRNAVTLEGSGLTVRVVINGPDAKDGDSTLELLASVATTSVDGLLSQFGGKFDYTESVSRTVNATHADSRYSVTLAYKPTTKPSFAPMALGRSQTATVLESSFGDILKAISLLSIKDLIAGMMPTVHTLDLSEAMAGYGSSYGRSRDEFPGFRREPRW